MTAAHPSWAHRHLTRWECSMQPWFRFYDDAVSDPKVQLLEGELFKTWVNLLCLANKNNGTLPNLKHTAFALRLTEGAVVTAVSSLSEAGLLDRVNATTWAPHNWRGRQFKSDSSTERVQRFRERHKQHNGNGAETHETPREKERETEEITPTGLSPPQREREIDAREARAPLEAPRARAPNGPTQPPSPPAPPQEVADDAEAQRLEIIRRRSDRQEVINAILAKPEWERSDFDKKVILAKLQEPTR